MDELHRLLESIGKVQGFESSYMYEGNMVPRVTAIISRFTNNEGLLRWANSLGFKHKSYSREREHAANIGTSCHESIDTFLCGKDIDTDIMDKEARCAYKSFQKWYYDIFLLANIEVIFHEKSLVCKYFGGTIDGLYKINNKIYLVDYKTSNHITFNYCLQLAAYRYMLHEIGIEIDGCIILQLGKKNISYNEYVLHFDNQEHLDFINQCERTFLSLVYSYYNILGVEESYENLDWEVK